MQENFVEILINTHLRTLPFSHAIPFTAARPSAWLRGTGAAGGAFPLFLVQDLGTLLTCSRNRLEIARPAFLPDDIDTAAYLRFLIRLARDQFLSEISSWDVSDAVTSVILSRLLEGVGFPSEYAVPGGKTGLEFARTLGMILDRAAPENIWRDTDPSGRPDMNLLLPPESMSRIEQNLRKLDPDEIRFMHRYGPRSAGAPNPEDLLDLFSLTGLPPAVRLAMSQVLRLLPRVSQTVRTGGVQTYAMGGYGGLTRKGSLDSLLPTELAYPDHILYHRLLNGEALYYGREGEQERRRELAYIITQTGMEMAGDYSVLARGLTLALSQAMQTRGYEVLHSFAAGELTDPEGMAKPGDVHRTLYYQDNGFADPKAVLTAVSGRLRDWAEQYRGIQVFWVLGEFWDADDWNLHADVYRKLKSLAGQQAWFIRCGSKTSQLNGTPPEPARQFHRHHIIHTALMWTDREPPVFDPNSENRISKPKKKPKYSLRSEPLEVSEEEAEKTFKLTDVDHSPGSYFWGKPAEYVKNEYEDRGEIVVDHATGLMWQKSGSDNQMRYEQAQPYVDELNTAEFAGYTDWRLPTVDELASLVEKEKMNEDLYIDPIFDGKQRWCWTADTRAGGGAWYVSFLIGLVYWNYLDGDGYVRVCRP